MLSKLQFASSQNEFINKYDSNNSISTNSCLMSFDIFTQSPLKVKNNILIKFTKDGQKGIKKDARRSCKIIKITSEWETDKVLEELKKLDKRNYPNLLVFEVELKTKIENEKKGQTLSNKIEEFKKFVANFCENRPAVLQILLLDEMRTRIFYKDEDMRELIEIQEDLSNEKDSGCDRQNPSLEVPVSSNISNFPSFLQFFMNIKPKMSQQSINIASPTVPPSKSFSVDGFLDEITKNLPKFEHVSLILRFLNLFVLPPEHLDKLILKVAEKGSKRELLAVLDETFVNDNRIMNINAHYYLRSTFDANCAEDKAEFSDKAESSEDTIQQQPVDSSLAATSILHTAISSSNMLLIDFLISNCSHLIQQLPYNHQIQIMTEIFDNNNNINNNHEILCDLLEFSDFPFPNDIKSHQVKHERLNNIIEDRAEFHKAISDCKDISKFDHRNLKIVFSPKNCSALYEALKSKNYKSYFYLKSQGFEAIEFSKIEEVLQEDELSKASIYASRQTKLNVKKSIKNQHKSVLFVYARSLIHNRKIDKSKEAEYRAKIEEWYKDVYDSRFGADLFRVASQCDDLRIIFDFESDLVENVYLSNTAAEGLTIISYKWIIIAAKYSNKPKEKEIKGTIAHEMCHYVMKLVFENDEQPYYSVNDHRFKKYSEICKNLKKWEYKGSYFPDDKCCGLISIVFIGYEEKDHHAEVIVRIPHIFARFSDDEDMLMEIETLYKEFIAFYNNFVVPELRNFSLRKREDVRRLNKFSGVLREINDKKIDFSVSKSIEEVVSSKIAVVASNVPRLLMSHCSKYLMLEYGNTFNAGNVFLTAKHLENEEILKDLKTSMAQNLVLRVFIDFSREIDIKSTVFGKLYSILVNENTNFVIIVKNEDLSYQKTEDIMCHREVFENLDKVLKNPTKMQINYSWNELEYETQEKLLKTKINFQNNSKVSLIELLSDGKKIHGHSKSKKLNQELDILSPNPNTNDKTTKKKQDFNHFTDIIDSQLLNKLVEDTKISIHTSIGTEDSNENFDNLFKQRKFIKKPEGSVISKDTLILKSHSEKYVLISDNAGTGKSWVMMNLANVIKDKNPTKWISYVDLKQLIEKIKKEMEAEETNHNEQHLCESECSDEYKNPESDQDSIYSDRKSSFGDENYEADYDFDKTYENAKTEKQKVTVCSSQQINKFKKFMINHIISQKPTSEASIFNNRYNSGNVCIFFDAFDEIAPNYAEFMLNLIKSFESNNGNQLWIASRDYFEVDLMANLELKVSYKLDKFVEQDGINLMTEIWVLKDFKNQNIAISKDNFHSSIKNSKNFSKYRKKAQELHAKILKMTPSGIGLPLLFKMITEIDFKSNLNLYEIFSNFVNKQYSRWSYKKGSLRKSANIKSLEFEMNFRTFHQFRGMELIFPYEKKFCDLSAEKNQWPDDEAKACGLLTMIDGKFYFNHRTFPEFFVADFIMRILEQSKIDGVFKFLKEVIFNPVHRVIRMFLNDAMSSKWSLKKLEEKAKILSIDAYVDENDDFVEVFGENLKEFETLEKFFNSILKNGHYDKVKNVLVKNVENILVKKGEISKDLKENDSHDEKNDENSQMEPESSQKQSSCSEKLNEILQKIAKSNLDSEIFEHLVKKLEEKTDSIFIHDSMKFKDFWHGNILHILCMSKNFDKEKILKFFEIFYKFLSIDGFIAMLKNCNRENESILHVCVDLGDLDKLKFMWKEIEKFLESKGAKERFKELVMQKMMGHKQKTIVHLTFKSSVVKFHNIFWDLMFETFKDRDELKDFLIRIDENEGLSFVHHLIKRSKLEVLETTFERFKKHFSTDHFHEILMSEDSWRRNLLQFTISGTKNFKKHRIMWRVFQNAFKTFQKFLNFLQDDSNNKMNVLHYAACESTSDFFEFMINELEKAATRNEIRILLSNLNKERRYLLQSAARFNKNIEIHESLWKILRKYFDTADMIKFIKHCDHSGKNLVLTAIEENTREIFELTWKEALNTIGASDISDEYSRKIKQLDSEIRDGIWFEKINKECDREKLRLGWIQIKNSIISHLPPAKFEEEIKQRVSFDFEELIMCEILENYKLYWRSLTEKFDDYEELKNQIIEKDIENANFVHRLITFSSPEIIEYTFGEFNKIFNHVQMLEIIKSRNHEERNLLQIAARYSTSLKTHQILWKSLKNACKSDKLFLRILQEVDYYKRDVLHGAACDSTGEIFKFMVTELEKSASREEIKRILGDRDAANRNFLQSAARWNKNLDLHNILWITFRNFFDPPDFYDFITHYDSEGNNIMLNAAEENTKEVFNLTWSHVRSFMKRNEQIEYLKHKGRNGKNLLEFSASNHENLEVRKMVVKIFQDYGIEFDA